MHVLRTTAIAAGLIALGCDSAGFEGASDSAGLNYIEVAPPPPPASAPAPEQDFSGRRAEARTRPASGQVAGAFSSQSGSQGVAIPAGLAQPAGQTAPSMIIRMGQASVEVDSLEPAVANVQALALRVGGYVANITMQTGRSQLRSGVLLLKVPAARFDETLEGLQPIGKLESLEVSAQDVGEEYADIEARVNNAKRLEQRLLTLLATRTGRLEDILAAERELARVREEIERYEGRMRYLQARATLSTLQITVHEPAPILGRNARNPIVDAFRRAWRNFVGFVAGLIEMSGFVIPLAAIGLGIVLAWRKWGPGFKREGRGEATA